MDSYLRDLTARNDQGLTGRLQAATVGIAGCGGLGSNVAVALARAGLGRLVLVDADSVEISNLNRQHFFKDDLGRAKVLALADTLRKINPGIQLETKQVRIGSGNLWELFSACDVIVEAFDTAEDKSMAMQGFADERFHTKFLVAASGLAGRESSNLIQTRRLARNIFVCGDTTTGSDGRHGLMAPRVMIAAGHQANMVVRILAGEFAP